MNRANIDTSALLGSVLFTTLFFLLPREPPVDKNGKIDYVGILLGLSSLVLFSFTWK
jgi:hypothetical protein